MGESFYDMYGLGVSVSCIVDIGINTINSMAKGSFKCVNTILNSNSEEVPVIITYERNSFVFVHVVHRNNFPLKDFGEILNNFIKIVILYKSNKDFTTRAQSPPDVSLSLSRNLWGTRA